MLTYLVFAVISFLIAWCEIGFEQAKVYRVDQVVGIGVAALRGVLWPIDSVLYLATLGWFGKSAKFRAVQIDDYIKSMYIC